MPSAIKRISGPALARNAMFIPHVTSFDKADVSDLETFRSCDIRKDNGS